MTFEEFLESRGLTDVASHFREEKIDCEILLDMTESELKKIIPKLGDRVAVISYCRKQTQHQKQSLIEKLKEKIQSGQKRKCKPSSIDHNKVLSGSKKKTTRVVEIGWLCFNKKLNEYKQVRAKFGGGTRKLSVQKDTKCGELLNKAKNLFFPNRLSSRGPLNQFDFSLFDFKSNIFDLDLNVQEMYEISAMSSLRFYLASSPKEGITIEENDDEFIPSTMTRSPSRAIESSKCFSDSTLPVTENEESFISPTVIHTRAELSQNNVPPAISVKTFEDSLNDDLNTYGPEMENLMLFEIELPDSQASIQSNEKIEIKVHRGQIFYELIEAFMNIHNLKVEIEFKLLLPNGKSELGLDFGGVYRDILSEFWETFYERCTTGYAYKVPVIRHDFSYVKWLSISKIFLKGYIDQKYFPIKLAAALMEYCIFGNTFSNLSEQFLRYLSQTDADTVKSALNANKWEEVDFEELLTVLESYDCKWQPDINNIKEIVNDIAHKELIQKPMFIIDCWQSILKHIMSKTELERIYETCNPTVKNILLALIPSTEIASEEIKILSYLKKFIKESDSLKLSSLLRFCTGSNVLTSEGIHVSFNKSAGASRSPIGHTCGFTLELPSTYENYQDFREELNNILNSNIWIMDLA